MSKSMSKSRTCRRSTMHAGRRTMHAGRRTTHSGRRSAHAGRRSVHAGRGGAPQLITLTRGPNPLFQLDHDTLAIGNPDGKKLKNAFGKPTKPKNNKTVDEAERKMFEEENIE